MLYTTVFHFILHYVVLEDMLNRIQNWISGLSRRVTERPR